MKLFPLIFTLLLWSCNSQAPDNAEENTSSTSVIVLSDEQIKNAEIQTGKGKQEKIAPVLRVFGTIEVPPQNIVSVSFPLGGYIKESHLLAGMHVRKNEVIAQIEDPQFIQLQQEYLTAKSKLELMQKELIRQQELNVQKAGSDKALQQAESDFSSQKVLLKSLSEKLLLISVNPNKLTEQNLSRSVNVLSPIDGFVAKVNVNIGKYVNPSDVVFELVNPDDIHLKMKVFEKDLNKLSVGQTVWAFNNAAPKVRHEASILLISKNLDSDHSAEVHCHFEDYDKTLLPGMYMNAEIPLSPSTAYLLPDDAIVSFEGKTYVFYESAAKTFTMTEVSIGPAQRGQTPVEKGLENLGDKNIVVHGAYSLLMQLQQQDDE